MVVGAGFSGLCALYKLRDDLGLRVRVLEMADDVGGTWHWNRYPGARVDIEAVEYSYSFCKEIEQEWVWSDLMPGQPELEAYLRFVADRLDLRRDIQLNTAVTAMTFDEDASRWLVETAAGDRFVAPFVVAATGLLSVTLDPKIPGTETFAGTSLFTSRYPKEGFDFSGKPVALIGTGSSGVQATPIVAEQAEHLYVLQRSGCYTFPTTARPFEPGEFDAIVANYSSASGRSSTTGTTRRSTRATSRSSISAKAASSSCGLTASRPSRVSSTSTSSSMRQDSTR
jgi:cation diffusion facilitator CzcD-associated flavoprotein CzcO